MRLPTVHINGTSAKDLFEQYSNAKGVVHDAIVAMSQAAPNGRDYYPQGPGAINYAMDEHWDRMKRLKAVADELEGILEYLSDKL